MLSFFTGGDEQNQSKKQMADLNKLGIIAKNQIIAEELHNQIIGEEKPKDVKEHIKDIFERLQITTLPIIVSDFHKTDRCEAVFKDFGTIYDVMFGKQRAYLRIASSNQMQNKLEFGISLDGETFQSLSGAKNTLTISRILPDIYQVYQYETITQDLYNWTYISKERRFNIEISVLSEKICLKDFSKLSLKLVRAKGNFNQIYNLVKSFTQNANKERACYATIKEADMMKDGSYMDVCTIKIQSGKKIETYKCYENTSFNWRNDNNEEEWELKLNIPMNEVEDGSSMCKSKYCVRLQYNKKDGYLLEVSGNLKNRILRNDKFGILKLIEQTESKVQQHLAGNNPSDTVFNIKTGDYTIDFSKGTRWRYDTVNSRSFREEKNRNTLSQFRYNISYNDITGWKFFTSRVIKKNIEEIDGVKELLTLVQNLIKNIKN